MDNFVAVILFAAAVLVGLSARRIRLTTDWRGAATARRIGSIAIGTLLLLIVIGLTIAQFIGIDIGSTFGELMTVNPFTPASLEGKTDYLDALLLLHPVSSTFLRLIALVGGLVLLDLGRRRTAVESRSELTLMIGTLLGGALVVFANDLFILWSGVEILAMSLPPSAADTSRRRQLPSLPGVPSFLALFGIIIIYGLFGTTSLRGIHEVLAMTNLEIVPSNTLLFGLLLIVGGLVTRLGLGYRRIVDGAHPERFHALILGCATIAIAGFGMIVQIFPGIITPELRGINADAIVITVAGFITLAGGLAAVRADSTERILLFGLAGHTGMAILGATVAGAAGIVAGTLSLILAVLSTVALFPMLRGPSGADRRSDMVSPTAASTEKAVHPVGLVPGILSGILLLTLSGIPLTGGFLSRIFLIGSLVGGPRNPASYGPDRLEAVSGGMSQVIIPVALLAFGSILLLYIYGRLFMRLYLRVRSGVHGAGFAGPYRSILTALVAIVAIITGLPQGFGIAWDGVTLLLLLWIV